MDNNGENLVLKVWKITLFTKMVLQIFFQVSSPDPDDIFSSLEIFCLQFGKRLGVAGLTLGHSKIFDEM